tara:strand:+ start:3688 stop:4488 length:801 start_codon:yes stop_codon:yes gene_type:complete
MNTQSYIASGILEAYALGKLSVDEGRDVERLVALYPELKAHMDQLGDQNTGKVRGNMDLKEALSKIEASEREAFIRVVEGSPNIQIKKVNVVSRWSLVLILLLLVSLIFNMFFFGQMKKSQAKIREIAAQNSSMAYKIESEIEKIDHLKLKMAHFLNDNNIHIRMAGSGLSPTAYANVFWDKNTKAVFLSADNLPEPPKGHQYQLWAIEEGKAPVDAGVIEYSPWVQQLKTIEGTVKAFAVTLEKEGGTVIPSTDRTYVIGSLENQ